MTGTHLSLLYCNESVNGGYSTERVPAPTSTIDGFLFFLLVYAIHSVESG